jgi:hypothetical protein
MEFSRGDQAYLQKDIDLIEARSPEEGNLAGSRDEKNELNEEILKFLWT